MNLPWSGAYMLIVSAKAVDPKQKFTLKSKSVSSQGTFYVSCQFKLIYLVLFQLMFVFYFVSQSWNKRKAWLSFCHWMAPTAGTLNLFVWRPCIYKYFFNSIQFKSIQKTLFVYLFHFSSLVWCHWSISAMPLVGLLHPAGIGVSFLGSRYVIRNHGNFARQSQVSPCTFVWLSGL